MSRKLPQATTLKGKGRDGLGVYIKNPQAHLKQVISHREEFTLIWDLYPKANIHLLLLPHKYSNLHPFEALSNKDFLSCVKSEALKAKEYAAKELERKFGPTRIWIDEVRIGIHSVPSMSHLHIHIISKDMHSECLRHRKHYNSFNTPFFIPLDDFPLDVDDERRKPNEMEYLRRDFVCWRCGKNFGNRFLELKGHLQQEFDKWKSGE